MSRGSRAVSSPPDASRCFTTSSLNIFPLLGNAAVAGMVTHNDPASIRSCVAFTAVLWQLHRMRRPPQRGWWLETFVLERHGHDPEEAIVRAVNDTRDNDTIAAIVGA